LGLACTNSWKIAGLAWLGLLLSVSQLECFVMVLEAAASLMTQLNTEIISA